MIRGSNILIVCNRVPFPLKDGGALAMYAMIKGWHDLGVKVHLLAINTSRHPIKQNELPTLFGEIASFEMVDMNTDICLLPTLKNLFFSEKPQHANRFYNLKFEQRIVELIAKINPEIIQLESIYLQEYVPEIRKHTNAKIVHRLHNIEGQVWQRLAKEAKPIFKKWYLNNLAKRIDRYERMAWQHCDALIPISKVDAFFIQDSGCVIPCCTIPFGLDSIGEVFSFQQIDNWDAYHIGAMDWQANIDAMKWMGQEIVPAILKRVPSFSFQFAGRNMPSAFLKYQSPSFQCVGEVADAEAMIADKKILIVPLRSGSGLRIKTLEAMAAGKIVISTNIGIQGIDVLDRKHFLLANNKEEFADAILWCQNNPREANLIAKNAQQLIREQYNQETLMKQMMNFVESLS